MSRLLFVRSSIFGENSKSADVAQEFIRRWSEHHPQSEVTVRDLGTTPVPHLSFAHLGALMTAETSRSAAQQESVAKADELIEELEKADVIVIASPMYNFTISSNLKAWIDHIARAGRTFRYTEDGRPEGLLKNKKVVVVTGRGGIYSEGPLNALDFQEPYLRTIFGFLGLTNITFIHVEGLRISPAHAEQGMAKAKAAIGAVLPAAKAA